MPEWTSAQREAIQARGGNILVSAAAGAGKTAVLVERVLHLIMDEGVDIDRLLIVTFTNAAAGEMRQRISARIGRALSEGGGADRHLRRQLTLLPAAQISTIHAFCLTLIRRFFHLIGIDPDFRLSDESEAEILRRDVAAELMECEYEQADGHFLGLVARIGGAKSDEPLVEEVLRLYDFSRSQPGPREWLRAQTGAFSQSMDALEDSAWVRSLLTQTRRLAAGARELTEQALSFCDASMEGYAGALRADREGLSAVLAGMDGGYESARSALSGFSFGKLGRCGAGAGDEAMERVKEWRKQVKRLVADAQELLALPLSKAHEQHTRMAPYLSYLAELVIAFEERYGAAKAKRRIADFTDLEHFALDILSHQEAAQALRELYDYIFIDEYQDSNLVQETLLSRVSRGDNLFMVGDVKQSIYRFRLADPSLFIRRYDACEAGEGKRILLNQNFRSQSPILSGVNYLFRRIMSRELGEIPYTEDVWLYPGRKTEENVPPIGVHLIDKGEAQSPEEEDLQWMEDAEREAYLAAAQIREWMEKPIRDAGGERPISYRDIAVLMRTTRGWMDRFAEILSREGIPVHADTGTGFFQAVEVRVFTELLRLIDNRRQDIPLIAALRSIAGGFDEDALSLIRGAAPQGAFHEAVDAYLDHGENEDLRNRLAAFTGQVAEWREAERRLPLSRFLWQVLYESGLMDHVGAMPGGAQRQANLRILCERAACLAETGTGRLFGFLRHVDRLAEEGRDIEPAKVLGEQEDAVRIMSVHKSKGLEFPAVILAGLGKRFNLSEGREEILLHKDLGLGPWYVDPDLRYRTQSLARLAAKTRIREESLAEEMRVLYVAMTRPRERLAMIGTVGSLSQAQARWMRGCGPSTLGRGMSLLDWVGAALLGHPDAEALGAQTAAGPESSRWDIRLWSLGDLTGRIMGREARSEAAPALWTDIDAGQARWVAERLSWRYPHACASEVPSKLSVTAVKRLRAAALEPDTPERLPVLAGIVPREPVFTAAERGSIVHYVMRHLDFKRAGTVDMIREQLSGMVARDLLRQEEYDTVDPVWIHRFCTSPLGERVRGAAELRREMPFLIRLPAECIAPSYAGCAEPLLVQGIIDCCFVEEGAWVLVDYKTDALFDGDIDSAANRYIDQIRLYRQALSQLTGLPVREAYLYFLAVGETVPVGI